MLPELAVAYVTGLPANALLSGLHAFLFHQKMRSNAMAQVQTNLAKLDLFWSDSESKVKRIGETNQTTDKASYYRTVLRLGVICFFMSWLGFFLQLLVMISVRFIARPRLEKALFSSELAQQNLSYEDIRARLDQISLTVMNSEIPPTSAPSL